MIVAALETSSLSFYRYQRLRATFSTRIFRREQVEGVKFVAKAWLNETIDGSRAPSVSEDRETGLRGKEEGQLVGRQVGSAFR